MGNLKNFFFLFVSTILGTLLTFVAQIYLAKSYTIEEVGIYSTILNLVNIIAIFIGFGTTDFMIKEFARRGNVALNWNKVLIIYLIINLFIATVIYFTAINILFDNSFYNFAIFFYMLLVLQGFVTLATIINQVEQNFLATSILNIILYIVRTGPVILASLLLINFKWIAFITIFFSFLGLLTTLPFLYKLLMKKVNIELESGNEEYENLTLLNMIKGSTPYGLMGLLYFIYYQGAILILAYFKTPNEVAIYSIAFSFIALCYTFPTILFRKLFFTKIHTWSVQDIEKLYKFYKKSTKAMFVISIITALSTCLFSGIIINVLYGETYEKAIDILKLFSIAIFFRFMYAVTGTILSTKKYVNVKIKIQSFVALLSLVFNLVYIPTYGVYGAVIITIISEVILFFLFNLYTKRYFQKERKLK